LPCWRHFIRTGPARGSDSGIIRLHQGRKQ
jgi:hypothetical protein